MMTLIMTLTGKILIFLGLILLLMLLIPLLVRGLYLVHWLIFRQRRAPAMDLYDSFAKVSEPDQAIVSLAGPIRVMRRPLRNRLSVVHWHIYYDMQLLRYRLNRTPPSAIALIPASMWLFDNYNLMYRVLKKFQESGELGSYRYLPVLTQGPSKNKPRIEHVARLIISLSNNRLRSEQTIHMLSVYQEVQILQARELYALPGIISLCLLERLWPQPARSWP